MGQGRLAAARSNRLPKIVEWSKKMKGFGSGKAHADDRAPRHSMSPRPRTPAATKVDGQGPRAALKGRSEKDFGHARRYRQGVPGDGELGRAVHGRSRVDQAQANRAAVGATWSVHFPRAGFILSRPALKSDGLERDFALQPPATQPPAHRGRGMPSAPRLAAPQQQARPAPISTPCTMVILCSEVLLQREQQRCERAWAALPVAGSSTVPDIGEKHARAQRRSPSCA